MTPRPSSESAIEQTAAEWVLRHDRGLSAEEQDAFSIWLSSDTRHRSAWLAQRWTWGELDRLAGLQTTLEALPDPDLLAPPKARRWTRLLPAAGFGLAAAAALTLAFIRFAPRSANPTESPIAVVVASPIEQQTLDDGSVVVLNRGARIAVHYTLESRHVDLLAGEASFQVAKNKDRPFVVSAHGVAVQAVGTAFNVRLGGSAIEVLVTEGKVHVHSASAADTTHAGVYLTASQRTRVPVGAPGGDWPVATLTAAEVDTRLAWQPRLLDFTDAPLADIVAEFNRRNPVRLTLADTGLGEERLSATFRSDNVEGFVRLMESDFGLRATRREAEIELRRVR